MFFDSNLYRYHILTMPWSVRMGSLSWALSKGDASLLTTIRSLSCCARHSW